MSDFSDLCNLPHQDNNNQFHLLFVELSSSPLPRTRLLTLQHTNSKNYTTRSLTLLINCYSQLLLLSDSGLEHIDLEV